MTGPKSAKSRSRRSDGEATRQRILDVSGERFAAAGLAETTNKDIAAHARVDLASINYHFGTRAGLYQAVLAEAHRRIVDRDDLERIVTSDASARDRLRALIHFILGGASGNVPWPVILLGREVLSPTSHFGTLQQEEVLPKLQVVLPLLSEITSIPADDPVLLRCLPAIAAPGVLIALVGRSDTPLAQRLNDADRDDIVEQLYRFALGGLESVGRWYASNDNAHDP